MPTRHLVSLIAVLIAVSYAAVSQGNGPAYLPAYALFSLLLVSWLHNRANIQQLQLTTQREAHGFAGAVVLLPFKLAGLNKKIRFGLTISSSIGGSAKVGKLDTAVDGAVAIPSLRRGVYSVNAMEVASIFPLGAFRAKTRHPVTCVCHVYPEPIGELEIPAVGGGGVPEKSGIRTSGDDFAGVRNYMTGESQRHIDWKAVARGQPMMVKQFESTSRREIWLTWESLRSLEMEARLSQIARWIIDCERAGLSYGLQLPGTRITPAHGDTHYHRCLRALAAFRG